MNPALFEQAVFDHRKPVYGYLRARGLDAAEAERLTREVFRRLHAGGASADAEALRPALLRVARGLLGEHVARGGGGHGWTKLCLEFEGEAPAFDDEALDRLAAGLDALDPSAREAVELTYRADWSAARLAERLRRSENAVASLLARARRMLREGIAGPGAMT